MTRREFRVIIGVLPLFFNEPGHWARLRNEGIELIDLRGRASPDQAEFVRQLKTASCVLIGNTTPVDERFFTLAPKLRYLIKMGVGVDNIDLATATRCRIPVFNSPGTNTEAVADYAFGLILALARRIVQADQTVRAREWRKNIGIEIWGKTLGIIGLGAIGRGLAQRAGGFNMTVLAHDPYWPKEFALRHGIEPVDLDELLRRSDVVSIHSPLTPETRDLIGQEQLETMKPGALLINTARGGLIDEAALYDALKEGRIAGAALDAYDREPPHDSPLLELDNILHSPHTAWATQDALRKMNESVAGQISRLYRGELPEQLVNPPALE